MQNPVRTVFLASALLLLTMGALRASEMSELKERFAERYAKIQALKNAGRIGETWTGYLEARPDAELDKEESALLSAENVDRTALYERIAEGSELSSAKVGQQNALRVFKKAPGEHWFKGRDGAWRQKKAMKADEIAY